MRGEEQGVGGRDGFGVGFSGGVVGFGWDGKGKGTDGGAWLPFEGGGLGLRGLMAQVLGARLGALYPLEPASGLLTARVYVVGREYRASSTLLADGTAGNDVAESPSPACRGYGGGVGPSSVVPTVSAECPPCFPLSPALFIAKPRSLGSRGSIPRALDV